MLSLLDLVIDSTLEAAAGPRVLSEQHDVNQINVGTGADLVANRLQGIDRQIDAIKRGSWDAAEYGISQADAIARLERAISPDAVEKELASLRERAIRRAGLDTSNGRVNVMVVVAGETPWHRLGVHVEAAVNSGHAVKLSGLDWRTEKRPLSYQAAGEWVPTEDQFAIVRTDTESYLGTVGSRYAPVQNAEGFAFLDSLMGEFGAKFCTAGSTFGGRKVWMQIELPRQAFALNKVDEVRPYAIFMNTHDGSGAARCFPTSERVVCHNTLRVALQRGQADGISIRHVGNVARKVQEARNALGLAVRGLDKFRESAEMLARTPCKDVRAFVNVTLDEVLDVTAAQRMTPTELLMAAADKAQLTFEEREAEGKRIDRAKEKRDGILEDILGRYENARNGIGGMRGTAWAALNAVTEHADHAKPARAMGSQEEQQSRRFESVLIGAADELKQVAYVNAVALAS